MVQCSLKCYSSCFFFLWGSSIQCLAALDSGAGVEQPFGCLIFQPVRPCSPWGGRWIRHWRTTWSTVCSPAPHSQAAAGAIPHLYKKERLKLLNVTKTINIFLAHFRTLEKPQIFSVLLRIMPAALPKSPLISRYQVVDASFQSTLFGPCIHTHLAYNVTSAYLIVWWLLSYDFSMWCNLAQAFHNQFFRLNIRF